MKGSEIRERLHDGRRVYGSAIISPSPWWPANLAKVGLDFVFLDTEHIAIDRAELSWMCRCYDRANLAPIVRIGSPDVYDATRVLDDGARGVIVPYVEHPEQIAAVAVAARHRPLRGDALDEIRAGTYQMAANLRDYIETRNADTVVIANIESIPAMQRLEKIVSVPGLDGILIGPHDLSTSLGIPEQYTHPDFLAAVETILTTARASGIGAGIHVTFPEVGTKDEIRWAKAGANLIVHSADVIAARENLRKEIGHLREELGDGGTTPASGAGPVV